MTAVASPFLHSQPPAKRHKDELNAAPPGVHPSSSPSAAHSHLQLLPSTPASSPSLLSYPSPFYTSSSSMFAPLHSPFLSPLPPSSSALLSTPTVLSLTSSPSVQSASMASDALQLPPSVLSKALLEHGSASSSASASLSFYMSSFPFNAVQPPILTVRGESAMLSLENDSDESGDEPGRRPLDALHSMQQEHQQRYDAHPELFDDSDSSDASQSRSSTPHSRASSISSTPRQRRATKPRPRGQPRKACTSKASSSPGRPRTKKGKASPTVSTSTSSLSDGGESPSTPTSTASSNASMGPPTAMSPAELAKAQTGGSGLSCHQCKTRKALDELFTCGNYARKKKAVGEARKAIRPCRKKYCQRCLPEHDTRVLTDSGFLFLSEIEARVVAGETVLYACYQPSTRNIVYAPGHLVYVDPPTRWVDFTHAGTRRLWDATSDDYGSTAPAAPANLVGRANRLTLRTTPEHDMYVQLCMKAGEGRTAQYYERRAGRALIPPHKMTAQELAPGYQCDCVAAGRTCTHGYSHYRMFTGAASGLQTPADVISLDNLYDFDDHDSPVVALDLRSEDQLDAFLELFGFWLGDGSMTYDTRAGLTSGNSVVFAPKKERERAYLRGLLARLHLVRGRHFTSSESDQALTVHITVSAWFQFFDDEFGFKYKASRHYNRRLALLKQGMHSLQRRPLRPSTASTSAAVSASATVAVALSSRALSVSASPPSTTRSLRSASLSNSVSLSAVLSSAKSPGEDDGEDPDDDDGGGDGSDDGGGGGGGSDDASVALSDVDWEELEARIDQLRIAAAENRCRERQVEHSCLEAELRARTDALRASSDRHLFGDLSLRAERAVFAWVKVICDQERLRIPARSDAVEQLRGAMVRAEPQLREACMWVAHGAPGLEAFVAAFRGLQDFVGGTALDRYADSRSDVDKEGGVMLLPGGLDYNEDDYPSSSSEDEREDDKLGWPHWRHARRCARRKEFDGGGDWRPEDDGTEERGWGVVSGDGMVLIRCDLYTDAMDWLRRALGARSAKDNRRGMHLQVVQLTAAGQAMQRVQPVQLAPWEELQRLRALQLQREIAERLHPCWAGGGVPRRDETPLSVDKEVVRESEEVKVVAATSSPSTSSSSSSDAEEDDDDDEDDPVKSAKWMPHWALHRLDKRQLRLVIEGLRQADGYSATTAEQAAGAAAGGSVALQGVHQICTSGLGFRDQLIHACLHAGYSAYFKLNTRADEVRGYKVHGDHDTIYTPQEKEAALQGDPTLQFEPVCGKYDSYWVCYDEVVSEWLSAEDVHFDGSACRSRHKRAYKQGWVAVHAVNGKVERTERQSVLAQRLSSAGAAVSRPQKSGALVGGVWTIFTAAEYEEQESGQAQQQAAAIATQTGDLYDRNRDGRVWCVEVLHDDHLIFVQRAHRNANGVVTKVGRSMITGNCLHHFYQEQPPARTAKGTTVLEFECPSCRLICQCAACKKRQQRAAENENSASQRAAVAVAVAATASATPPPASAPLPAPAPVAAKAVESPSADITSSEVDAMFDGGDDEDDSMDDSVSAA